MLKNALIIFSVFIFSLSQAQAQKPVIDERDGQSYSIVRAANLEWFASNLNYKTADSRAYADSAANDSCFQFYRVNEAMNACPAGWRLPTEPEVKQLLKQAKKQKFSVEETLNISFCGRIDGNVAAKVGSQTTFWIDSELVDGNITHWHFFKDEIELHNHNVINADRKFPVRCVRSIE